MSSMGRLTIRDLGYTPGQLPPGPKNSILDVKGVHVGQATVGEDGEDVRKGVTVILPRHPDDITVPSYAGMHTLNGNGEVTGSYQIKDWGFINTPIALTNSISLGVVYSAIWRWVLQRAKDKNLGLDSLSNNYGTPVVGETADWWLNDVHNSMLQLSDVEQALKNAITQEEVIEGQNGGGAGMTCHMFPAGTGTSSRVVKSLKEGETYMVGVLVQTNYGITYDFQIGGVPVGKILMKEKALDEAQKIPGGKADAGSIVVILITDAPMLPHQLNRLARHCGVGLTLVGSHGVGANPSGDIFLAISTANKTNELIEKKRDATGRIVVEKNQIEIIKNQSMDALFRAASEATEEAILNSIVAGREGRTGFEGRKLDGLPVERVKELLKKHLVAV